MKKIICAIIAVVCLSGLISCADVTMSSNKNQSAAGTVVNKNDELTSKEPLSIIATEAVTEAPPETPGPQDEAPLWFLNISEYNDFISKAHVSEEFVTYEEIQHLGEFKELIFHYNFLYEISAGMENLEIDYSCYQYELKDSTGFTFSITFDNVGGGNDKGQLIQQSEQSVVLTNMQSFGKENGYLCVDDLKYVYKNGNLRMIEWYDGATRIYVYGDFENYPTNGNSTFVDSLINSPETAGLAVKQFLHDISNVK